MPLFERPPLETLAPAKERWTPLYLEHGRLEVDDSSVQWIGADGLLCRIPVATVSALLLGPGTTVTHAAMKACAESNTPVCWTGAESLRFYAFGLTPNHTNDMPRLHAAAWADKKRRTEIARRMFRMRFPELGRREAFREGAARHGRAARARALRRAGAAAWRDVEGPQLRPPELGGGRRDQPRPFRRQRQPLRALRRRGHLARLPCPALALCTMPARSPSSTAWRIFINTSPASRRRFSPCGRTRARAASSCAVCSKGAGRGRAHPAADAARPGAALRQRRSCARAGGSPATLRPGMTVLIAHDTPPAIRGMLKRWFVEPKPNVFVGTLNRRTRDKVLDYVKRNAAGMSLLILSSEPNCQGFKIERWGEPDRRDATLSGLRLVAEKWVQEEEDQPF